MNFEVEKNGSSVTLKLKERKLDSAVSPELKGEFLILCKPKIETLNVDLKEVEFCDSSGLSALLIAERKMKEHGGKVVLRNVHKKVVSLIKISMLDRVFEIHESHQPAKH
ncbi:MAG: STAS domain-containing protein [Bacteroidetes bacterium]|nr:STAS domain-containing protein [Bacteroidota bacterium]MCW5895581.1 STAS domain-containing protein [Bacteroidota bacterium]